MRKRTTKLYEEWIGKGTIELYEEWKKIGTEHNEKLKGIWDMLLLREK